MATTKKKRSFDAAFKLRVVEYAEQDTNRGAGRKFQELQPLSNCRGSRIVASPYYGMKILAAASDRANTVCTCQIFQKLVITTRKMVPIMGRASS